MASEIARRLRKNMTVDERRLWAELRLLRRQGYHFRRQAPFGPYVLDFVCFTAYLAIEVDGVQHELSEGKEKDAARDAALSSQGFKVLRFTNGNVTNDRDGVVLEIMEALGLAERPPDTWRDWQPPTPSPPHKGEGRRECKAGRHFLPAAEYAAA